MARVKISEFQAKTTLLPSYRGLAATSSTTVSEIANHFPGDNLVLKLDQGIKKRGKLGLVKVNLSPKQIPSLIKEWVGQGWSSFLIEPVVEHAPEAEHYLALERVRGGWQVSYSNKGGIDVESSWDLVERTVLDRNSRLQVEKGSAAAERTVLIGTTGQILKDYLETLIPLIEQNHIVFLEMNPILIRGDQLIPLDMAAEIDNTGSSLIALPDSALSDSERQIAALDASTPASLKFKLINPHGNIWVLLSGGGASLVLADEVADQGMGDSLANYGEYSGAPKADDVYSYTKIILSTMLQAVSRKPYALVIAAGVANFTDVAKTFSGIIRALDEVKAELKKAKVKVFVRRGGPNEAKGLKMMGDFLTTAAIPHTIHRHEIPLTQVISDVKKYLENI